MKTNKYQIAINFFQFKSPISFGEGLGVRFLFSIFFLLSITGNSQSFQWAKRGGSTDTVPSSGYTDRLEEVINIVTDSNKNIYILSKVGKSNLEVDGHWIY